MSRRKVPKEELCAVFDNLDEWAFLRNADVFENFERGGDCDLLVKDLEAATKIVLEGLGPPNLVARRSYVRSFYYSWGHLDLTDHYYWRGIRLLPGRTMLDNKIFIGEYPLVSPVDEAITRLLSSLLWGGFIKERYSPEIMLVYQKEKESFQNRLGEMLGEEASAILCSGLDEGNLEELVDEVSGLRATVRKHYKRQSLIRYWVGWLRFTGAEILLRIRDLFPIMILRVDPADRVDFDAEWDRVTGDLDQHCKAVETGVADSICSMPLVLLRNISYRARNGILVLVECRSKKCKKPFWSRFVDSFYSEYTREEGLDQPFEEFYAYCVSRSS